MINKSILPGIILLSLITFSCKKTYEKPSVNVVVNELMPVNSSTEADQNGEFDDWIELYNLSSSSVNLSGYYLSDNKKEPGKWKIPQGTIIASKGYLIVWADNDTTQAGLHANFKLSSQGEDALISDPEKTILDKTSFPPQSLELTWSRVPNGTGEFKWQAPTFNRSNGSK
jgi:hypothetical protein